MNDESVKRAAQEYVAERLSELGQSEEAKLNREAAFKLAYPLWRQLAALVLTQCNEWNAITQEQTFTCRETPMGDLRVLCPSKSHQMIVHFDSRQLLITLKNSARLEHEKDTVFSIEGYLTDSGRQARLTRNNQPANFDFILLGHLRLMAGIARQT